MSDEVIWLLADHQGTVRDIADDNGTLRKHTDYDSFGNIVDEVFYDAADVPIPLGNILETVDQNFHFAGREWDEKLDAYYNRARWYDPDTGRFLSEDSIGFDSGDPNLYRYASNNPVTNSQWAFSTTVSDRQSRL